MQHVVYGDTREAVCLHASANCLMKDNKSGQFSLIQLLCDISFSFSHFEKLFSTFPFGLSPLIAQIICLLMGGGGNQKAALNLTRYGF